jgi:hypothetical protein
MLLWEQDCSHCGGREGLLCVVTVCGNPQCHCSEVFVEATLVNDGLVAAEISDDTVRSHWRPDCKPPARRKAVESVELNDGSARIATNARRGARSRNILARFQRQLDEDLLGHLRRVWRARQGTLHQRSPVAEAQPAAAAAETHEPERRAPTPTARVARNQPCPCGSRKKYKRCCGA